RAGCGGHRRPVAATPPEAPSPSSTTAATTPSPAPERNTDVPRRVPPPPAPPPAREPDAEIAVPEGATVLYSEVGWASWYGPGFQNRHAANGEVFYTDRMTAAHRTPPPNTIAREP